ncbi:MAG: acyl carrier protein [Opitutales bacterium]|nr:acyl carrier protein [Opitutales bacterium]
MDKKTLIDDIKNKLVVALNLQGVSADDIDENSELFSDDGLGLDSVDALELVVMVEREYGVVVDENDDRKTTFASVSSLADYIISKKS